MKNQNESPRTQDEKIEKDREKRKVYFDKLDNMNQEGRDKVYDYIDMLSSLPYHQKNVVPFGS